MYIYLICFAISVGFAKIAEKKIKNRKQFLFWSILSITITALLAGLRDISVGIDTANFYYGTWTNAIRSSSFSKFLLLFSARHSTEYLYAVLVGIIAKTTGDFHLFLFVVHTIIIGCFYIGAFRLRKHAKPAFSLLLFYLFYFNVSLNLFRQYMAVAILFAAAADLEEKHHIRYLCIILVAFFIHHTAVFGVILLILYRLLHPNNRLSKLSFGRRILLYCLVLAFAVALLPLLRVVYNMGYLSEYSYFINTGSTSSYNSSRLLAFVELIGVIVFLKAFKKNSSEADFYLFCIFSFNVFYQLVLWIPYGSRLSIYFSLSNIVAIGMFVRSFTLHKNRTIVQSLVIVIALVFWYYTYVYHNSSITVPYMLGI